MGLVWGASGEAPLSEGRVVAVVAAPAHPRGPQELRATSPLGWGGLSSPLHPAALLGWEGSWREGGFGAAAVAAERVAGLRPLGIFLALSLFVPQGTGVCHRLVEVFLGVRCVHGLCVSLLVIAQHVNAHCPSDYTGTLIPSLAPLFLPISSLLRLPRLRIHSRVGAPGSSPRLPPTGGHQRSSQPLRPRSLYTTQCLPAPPETREGLMVGGRGGKRGGWGCIT